MSSLSESIPLIMTCRRDLALTCDAFRWVPHIQAMVDADCTNIDAEEVVNKAAAGDDDDEAATRRREAAHLESLKKVLVLV